MTTFQEHKGNLRAALDQCSVREPDLELVSADGRRVFGHRSDHFSLFLNLQLCLAQFVARGWPTFPHSYAMPLCHCSFSDRSWESSPPCWWTCSRTRHAARWQRSSFQTHPRRFSLIFSTCCIQVSHPILSSLCFIKHFDF